MRIRTLRYYLREAFRSLVRNRLMSVASIMTVASCIFIVSVFYCIAVNIEYFMIQTKSEVIITIFIESELSGDEVTALYEKVTSIPHVTHVQYYTANEALEEMKEKIDRPELLDGLERDNPLRRSFVIEIEDLIYHDDIIIALDTLRSDGIGNITYDQNVVNLMQTIADGVNAVCLALILILGIISIVIIFNTIRITVNARRSEINIMKYVGATDWFIRWPFVIEGILIGVTGGFLPAFICWLSYERVIRVIIDNLPLIDFMFRGESEIFKYLIPFDLILGMLIGVIGSFFSVRRHLKV